MNCFCRILFWLLFWRQRFYDCVRAYPFFFLRRKKNSEKERPLRGFRREVRFIMSPPGKRRHNELNAAPPPETPPGTGKPGETNNRDVVHSGESFCIRAKDVCQPSPPRGRCRRSRRMRCSAIARLCRQMLHFASLTEILSLRYRLSVFLSRRKKNSEKERPLRGLRREVRFIMSPQEAAAT